MREYKIITVHGTYASDTSIRGVNWWQIDSKFSDSILSYLNTKDYRIHWIPHGWTGANSQRDRRESSTLLARLFSELCKDPNAVVACIAHSHGGNVAQYALDQMTIEQMKRGRGSVVRLITVGTPFFSSAIDSFGALWSLLRNDIIISALILGVGLVYTWFAGTYTLEVFLFTIYLAILLSFLPLSKIFASRMVTAFVYHRKAFDEVTFSLPFEGVVRVLARLKLPFIGSSLHSTVERARKVVLAHLDRNLATPKLYSRLDEAINALRATPNTKVAIATDRLVRFPCFLIAAMVLMFGSLTFQWKLPLAVRISEAFQTSGRINLYAFGIDVASAEQLLDMIFLFITCVIVGYLLSYAVLSKIVARLINILFRSSLIAKAYGADTAEPIGAISANVSMLIDADKWRPLPKEIDDEIEDVLDAQAQKLMRVARERLGLASIGGTHDLVEAILASFTWKEMVHSAYFEADSLMQLIAWILVEKYGFPPSENYTRIDTARCLRWYCEISPIASRKMPA